MAGVWKGVLLVMLLYFCITEILTQSTGGAKSNPKKKKPPKKKEGTATDSKIPVVFNFNINQMGGTWYLSSVVTKCSSLLTFGRGVEPTVMILTLPSKPQQPLSVSTITRHNHQCWEVLQVYTLTQTPGQFVLKGSRPLLDTSVTVLDTDHASYTIIHYKQKEQVSLKLYSRSKNVPEAILDKFEETAQKQGFGLEFITPFPNYSHCDTEKKDKMHVINCIPFC